MAIPEIHASIKEREFVPKSAEVKSTSGFTANPSNWMGRSFRKPTTATTLECSHILRSSLIETASGFPALEYRLWQEAGKQPPPLPHRPDDNYNSNVWRNFRKAFGVGTDLEKSTPRSRVSDIDDTIAAIYPVNIPKPSRMGEHSYARYIEDSELFSLGPVQTRKIVV